MKKDQLENFIAIVEAGSINKAAEKLYITQPSLSRSMKSLEEEMGKPLLERNTHGVSLTATGKIFYNYAQSILNQFNMLERLKDFDEDVVYSKLSVSVNSIFLEDNLIYNFYKKINSLETEISILETLADDVLNDVASSTSEIGIIVLNDFQLKIFRRMAEIKDIELEIFDEGPLVIHSHESCSLNTYEKIESKELMSHIYIHLPYDFISNLNYTLQVDEIGLKDLSKTITMTSYHAVLKMLQNTDSFILGNKWQVKELKASHIDSREIQNSKIIKYFIIIKRKGIPLSRPAEVFLELIRNDYKDS